jgi:hypothetical protein
MSQSVSPVGGQAAVPNTALAPPAKPGAATGLVGVSLANLPKAGSVGNWPTSSKHRLVEAADTGPGPSEAVGRPREFGLSGIRRDPALRTTDLREGYLAYRARDREPTRSRS